MHVGIPKSAMASGGIYYWKDGRTVSDVYQVAYDYPQRNLTIFYSATLASRKERGEVIMGHDAHMDLGQPCRSMQIPITPNMRKKSIKV